MNSTARSIQNVSVQRVWKPFCVPIWVENFQFCKAISGKEIVSMKRRGSIEILQID
jgi:hypothetical protein